MSAVPPGPHVPMPPSARPRGPRAMSLVFRFELMIDDRKVIVANRPGDAVRLRALDADLDQTMGAGGVASYEILFRFAWQAARHHDDYGEITWDEFLDRCESWTMLDDDDAGPVRPTVAGPSNE